MNFSNKLIILFFLISSCSEKQDSSYIINKDFSLLSKKGAYLYLDNNKFSGILTDSIENIKVLEVQYISFPSFLLVMKNSPITSTVDFDKDGFYEIMIINDKLGKANIDIVTVDYTSFDWISSKSDTIIISQSNLTDTYNLQWGTSTVKSSVNYLVYAKIGVNPPEEIYDTTSTSVSITYQELLENVLEVLNKIGKITIIGKDESCPATVSVANIITQNILNGITKTEKISVDSEISDDGRLISTIEIIIAKISS